MVNHRFDDTNIQLPTVLTQHYHYTTNIFILYLMHVSSYCCVHLDEEGKKTNKTETVIPSSYP